MDDQQQICGRCGEIWEPVLHVPSGRRLCKCSLLSLEALHSLKKPVQVQALFMGAGLSKSSHARRKGA